MAEPKPVDKLNYEEAFSELEAIVASLESGDQPLEKATAVFTRGQALVKRCAELLEKAELKVRQLTGEEVKDFEAPE
ncbi:MAG: exodeoxyribonuclease VII small subunit [Chloroflexota bacterium]